MTTRMNWRRQKVILVTGVDGYLGWPVALRLVFRNPEFLIVGVDHEGRRHWAKEVGGGSIITIAPMKRRADRLKALGRRTFRYHRIDLGHCRAVEALVEKYRPAVVIHLAAQSSGRFAEIDVDHAHLTQEGNSSATRNLLWSLKAIGPKDRHFIMPISMGLYAFSNHVIPEGDLIVPTGGKPARFPHPMRSTNAYQLSKTADAQMIALAAARWGIGVSELRTGLLFGAETQESLLHHDLATRLDVDPYFGTVVHRLAALAVAGAPMPIYGGGGQHRPLLALIDAVDTLARIAVTAPRGHQVYNLVGGIRQVKELAIAIRNTARDFGITAQMTSIPNPRQEDDCRGLRINRGRFRRALGRAPKNPEDELPRLFATLLQNESRIRRYVRGGSGEPPIL